MLNAPVAALQADQGAKDQEYENDVERPQNLCEYFVNVVMQ